MINYSLDRLIRIAITLSAEKQIDALLDTILAEAMEITAADGGTIYIREGEQLSFHNVVTRSLGVHLIRRGREEILPPVPMDRLHVCACAALEHRLVNIPDVYEAEDYNFTGTRRYDAINHYRTRSMLVVPMEDEKGRCIGVLQLLNALNEKGEVVPFRQEDERIIAALGSLAAVSLYNRQLQKAVTDIMHSFVQVMVDAIDARTPFNASHTRSMVRYAGRFVRWLNRQQLDWRFEEDETEPFLMSVWLHDIGKIAIPTAIMDKRTRLGSLEEGLRARIDIALLQERIRALENPEAAAEAEKQICLLRQARDTIRQANPAGFLPEELLSAVEALRSVRCLNAEGETVPLLTPEEADALLVRKGTLTAAERHEIERHVVYTRKFLEKMKFSGIYEKVPGWASAHHELLDGSGYPNHVKAEKLSREVRLLTILDIYDALTAEDRPYKPPIPPERAFEILEDMCTEGKLDREILDLFRQSGAWKAEPAEE